MAADVPRLVSLSEAERIAPVTRERLAEARDRGEITVYKLGRQKQLVALEDVFAWIRQHAVHAPEPE